MFQRLTDVTRLQKNLVELTTKLKAEKNPLVGLQYMIFLNDKEQDPFLCTLCNNPERFKKGNLKNMIQHFKSRSHRLIFLKKHFPTVHDTLLKILSINEIDDENFERLLKRICSMIVARYGRKNPVSISNEQYKLNQNRILEKLYEESNAKEKPQSPLLIDLLLVITRFDKRHSSTTPPGPSNMPSPKPDPLKEYEIKYEDATAEIEREYSKYNIQKDTHPDYDKEWKFYYHKLYTQMLVHDPAFNESKFDFVKFWKETYWPQRLTLLKQQEIVLKRIVIRQEMNLPKEENDMVEHDKIMTEKIEMAKYLKNIEEISLKNNKRKLENIQNEAREQKTKIIKMSTEETRSVCKNDENSAPSTDSKEKSESKEAVPSTEDICFLFRLYDSLDEDIKTLLKEYLSDLKQKDPVEYENLINTPVDEAAPSPSIGKDQIDEEYDDSEMIEKVKLSIESRNAHSQYYDVQESNSDDDCIEVSNL